MAHLLDGSIDLGERHTLVAKAYEVVEVLESVLGNRAAVLLEGLDGALVALPVRYFTAELESLLVATHDFTH
eukprot:CAMPEP_0113880554 /NCGR_PEP_ID=MMETSP0780_2-20120614/7852_1 /TAXON_ID=652834 /ORGANISM="Palpitomonas bilix" /LENGTH=71 /DNA_ID=CAMNT_0000867247 /DNA_START=68 /DNA_END=280 /DNA_ORIENTATION=- /assembly_acc=CAM_ASM_000599